MAKSSRVTSGSRPGRHWRTSGRSSDRKSTRLNSSHRTNSYAVFCLKKIRMDSSPCVPMCSLGRKHDIHEEQANVPELIHFGFAEPHVQLLLTVCVTPPQHLAQLTTL